MCHRLAVGVLTHIASFLGPHLYVDNKQHAQQLLKDVYSLSLVNKATRTALHQCWQITLKTLNNSTALLVLCSTHAVR